MFELRRQHIQKRIKIAAERRGLRRVTGFCCGQIAGGYGFKQKRVPFRG